MRSAEISFSNAWKMGAMTMDELFDVKGLASFNLNVFKDSMLQMKDIQVVGLCEGERMILENGLEKRTCEKTNGRHI